MEPAPVDRSRSHHRRPRQERERHGRLLHASEDAHRFARREQDVQLHERRAHAVRRDAVRRFAHRGTRFVQTTFGGWDHHSNIYAKTGSSLFTQMKTFDPAFGALLTDLSTMPGQSAGKTLLDETLVVVLGEFGRTTGNVNGQGGRDHFLRMSVVFAGGGIRGGQVIGSTDALGANAKEFGWSGNRDVRLEDVTSTIYSALGIDYTTVRHDDPLNRGFEYVPFAKDGTYGDRKSTRLNSSHIPLS